MAFKELIATIAEALVDDPDGVEVTEIDGDRPIDEVAGIIRRELEAVEVE